MQTLYVIMQYNYLKVQRSSGLPCGRHPSQKTKYEEARHLWRGAADVLITNERRGADLVRYQA